MNRIRSARLRLRLTAAAFALSLLIVSAAVIALVVVLRAETEQTITDRLDERATALAATIGERRGRVDVGGEGNALFDGPNWVYAADGSQLGGPTANGPLQPLLTALSVVRAARTVDAAPWHLRGVPVTRNGTVVAVAVTGVNDQPYAETLSTTARAAVVFGLLAVLGATGLTALVLSRSLGPIAVMTEQAAGWSRRRSDGRFALGPPKDEIGRLAAVLDDLLDRVDAALTAERRLTAEIAHELRTPLTLLSTEAQIALMSHATPADQRIRFERIQNAADTMARAITTLLTDAAASAERDETSAALQVARGTTGGLDFSGEITITGDDAILAVPAASLERMLAPLLENASSLGATRIEIRVEARDASAIIRVEDDGPGVTNDVHASLFQPGVSTKAGGTGLGLSLAQRLARDAGGDLRLASARPAVFELRLPSVPDVAAEG